MQRTDNWYCHQVHHRIGNDSRDSISHIKSTGINTFSFDACLESCVDRVALKSSNKYVDSGVGGYKSNKKPVENDECSRWDAL